MEEIESIGRTLRRARIFLLFSCYGASHALQKDKNEFLKMWKCEDMKVWSEMAHIWSTESKEMDGNQRSEKYENVNTKILEKKTELLKHDIDNMKSWMCEN